MTVHVMLEPILCITETQVLHFERPVLGLVGEALSHVHGCRSRGIYTWVTPFQCAPDSLYTAHSPQVQVPELDSLYPCWPSADTQKVYPPVPAFT